MKLTEILKGVAVRQIVGPDGVEISALALDSRQVEAGTMFFALRGEAVDGHDYIAAAIERGAAAIVCERLPEDFSGTTFVLVHDSHLACGFGASNFYGNPSRALKLVGVTGTNGKTTTATLLFDMMRALGYEAGLVSTVENRIGTCIIPSTHTTPDPIRLNALLAEMVECGCEYCFMEVSSHAIVQQRIGGLTFAGGAFSNITHDHLDYHGTFANYIAAKKKFFDDLPAGAFAVTNLDDRNGRIGRLSVQNRGATFGRNVAEHRRHRAVGGFYRAIQCL